MSIKITTRQILIVLQVVSWIIFIGLCINAGSIAVNTILSLFINPKGPQNFWEGGNYLSSLFLFDRGYFMVVTFIMTIVAVLKAIMFYLIIRLFMREQVKISEPFSLELSRFISHQSFLALGIGLFSHAGNAHTRWLTSRGMQEANLQSLHIGGADVWLFMAVILFLILHIVKRGMELQKENSLTI